MIIPFIIAALVIAADQFTKYIVKTNMTVGESFNLVKYILNIRYVENEGASFGILKDHRWVFMILSSVALVLMAAAIVYLGRKSIKKSNLLINISLALMFGGGVGNMIDRLTHTSAILENTKVVVDFLEFAFVDFAIFNVADSFVCIGSVLFCILMFAGKYKISEDKETKIKVFGGIEVNEVNEITDDTES